MRLFKNKSPVTLLNEWRKMKNELSWPTWGKAASMALIDRLQSGGARARFLKELRSNRLCFCGWAWQDLSLSKVKNIAVAFAVEKDCKLYRFTDVSSGLKDSSFICMGKIQDSAWPWLLSLQWGTMDIWHSKSHHNVENLIAVVALMIENI